MKGLLIKDLCLLKSQKKILPVYLLLAVWFTVMHNDGFGLPLIRTCLRCPLTGKPTRRRSLSWDSS